MVGIVITITTTIAARHFQSVSAMAMVADSRMVKGHVATASTGSASTTVTGIATDLFIGRFIQWFPSIQFMAATTVVDFIEAAAAGGNILKALVKKT